MSDLPRGWEWATLEELGDSFGGGTPPKHNPEYWTNGTVPWLSPKDMGSDRISSTRDKISESALTSSAARLVPPNSTAIVVRSGILERRLPVTVVPFATSLNQDMRAVVPRKGIAESWIAYFLRSAESQILRECSKRGTTVASIDVAKLMRTRVPIAPEPEQRRIVAALEDHISRIDVGARQLGLVKKKLRTLEQSMLKQVINAGASAWPSVQIRDIARVTSGATPLKSRSEYYDGGDIPWITSSQLNDRYITTAERFITKKALTETPVKILPAGSLLVAMYGEGKTRGKCSELSFPATINQACAALALDPKYYQYRTWVKTFFEANYESHRSMSAGGVQPNLNLSLIKNMTLALPPVAEATSRLAQLDNHRQMVDRLMTETTKAHKLGEGLHRSLLLEAFAGRLVPQDPNDEPASVLLERIRAERSTRQKPKRSRRVAQPDTTQEALL